MGADENMKRRIPFTFLEDIKRRFVTQYGESVHNAIAFAFNTEFSPVLQTQMEFYNNDPNADGLNKVKVQLDDVKNVMVENIEKVLERGEKIELLVDKTDRLNEQAAARPDVLAEGEDVLDDRVRRGAHDLHYHPRRLRWLPLQEVPKSG